MFKKIIHIFLLAVLFFGFQITEANAGTNNFYVDKSILGKSFSDWDLSGIYNEDDLVIYEDKVYVATEEISGIVPGTDSRWIYKADLSFLNTINTSDKCELTANVTDNVTRYTMKIPVLTYEGAVSSSKYVFTVHTTIPETPLTSWDASVWSFIYFDDGSQVVSTIDSFEHGLLKPNVKRNVTYSYHHIKEVKAVITGNYNGRKLEPTGCFMQVPRIPMV